MSVYYIYNMLLTFKIAGSVLSPLHNVEEDKRRRADLGIPVPRDSHIEVVAEPATQCFNYNYVSMSPGRSERPLPSPARIAPLNEFSSGLFN